MIILLNFIHFKENCMANPRIFTSFMTVGLISYYNNELITGNQ